MDKIDSRLQFAQKNLGIEVVDIKAEKDIVSKFKELVPGGLDVGLDCSTFHEPKTISHKVQRALMLETDVPEILNEIFLTVKKGGRCGIIADYIGTVNGLNIGAVMEKGIRVIGNGQGWLLSIAHQVVLIVFPNSSDTQILGRDSLRLHHPGQI